MDKLVTYVTTFSLIFMGAVFYTIASYYHLKFGQWSLSTALMFSLPFAGIEYAFALQGNYLAYKELGLEPSKILIVTIIFNFICIWVFNYFVMNITWDVRKFLNEFIAFLFIIAAFSISNIVH